MLVHLSRHSRDLGLLQTKADVPPSLLNFLPLLGLVLIIWQTVCLVQLKPIARWFCIGYMGLWTVNFTYNIVLIVGVSLGKAEAPNTTAIVVVVVFWLVIVSLNFACAWYLGRKKFREFCARYLANKH